MSKTLALATLTAAFVCALPSVALAKGPIEATVEGPGLGSPLRFGGFESEDAMAPHQPLMQFAEAAGFFPAVFEQTPDPMLAERPKVDLGPRYVIDYRVPGPYGEEWLIVQELYPYAKPNPVTYMEPGQAIYESETHGGWYVATNPSVPSLTFLLTEAGLPKAPPSAGDGSPFPWTLERLLTVAAVSLVLGGLALALLRRRPHPAL